MNGVPAADRLAHVEDAVAVGIAKPPEIGRRSHVQVGAAQQQAAGDIRRDILIEALERDQRGIGDAVVVGIFDSVDPLLDDRQITPIPRAVVVVVGQPRVLQRCARAP